MVDVVDIPGDAKTALGKRGDVLEQLWDKWSFEGLWGKPKKLSGARASSSYAVRVSAIGLRTVGLITIRLSAVRLRTIGLNTVWARSWVNERR